MPCAHVGARRGLAGGKPLRVRQWVVVVRRPMGGIVVDVLTGEVQFLLCPNDALVAVPLPHLGSWSVSSAVDALDHHGLELSHDASKGTCHRSAKACLGTARSRSGVPEQNDCVEMVGHHNERVQRQVRTHNRRSAPLFRHDISVCIQAHNPIDNLPETADQAVRADRDEVRAGTAVVVARHTDRAAAEDSSCGAPRGMW
jgi:hypothetical protein